MSPSLKIIKLSANCYYHVKKKKIFFHNHIKEKYKYLHGKILLVLIKL